MKKLYYLALLYLLSYATPLSAQQYVWVPTVSTTSNTIPFASSSNIRQWIYYPTDFPTAPSGNITDIYIKASAAITPNITNLTIKMGSTSLSTFTAGPFATGLQTVYTGNYTASTVTGNYIKITLQVPFYYDNTQNFIIEASQTGYSPGFSVMQATSGAAGRSLFGTLPASTGSLQDRLADFGFDLVLATPCIDPPTAGTATANNVNVCPGSNVLLNLTGHTQGTGQTYQWESASAVTGPWMIEGLSSAASALSVMPLPGTTYYRCQLSCGTMTVPSVPVAINVLSGLTGSYTINALQPASTTNFQTLGDAMSAVTCAGVSGPVVFDIATGSGPYSEQVVIGAIPGASAINTITINGNGETVSYTSTASPTRPTFLLNGTSYVTLNNINIQAGGATYGWGVHLTNDADYDTIRNCTISITSTSTTASNSAGIVASGSGTSITTAGNSDNIVVMNNTITGAYQGIILTGSSTANLSNNKIIGNTIKDFYSDGIIMTYNLNPEIAHNDISRETRVTVTTFTGIELGAGNTQSKIYANKIHDTHNAATTQSGAAYGIHITGCDATSGNENLVYNNLVYNFNSTTGIQNGLRNTGSDGTHYYHNTVVHDNSTSTSGATYAFYQTTSASNIDLKNNVFYITRTGSGTKHCQYHNTAASTITSNNNVLYINAPAGNNYIGRNGGTDHSWTGWQGAGFDLSGSDQDPLFQSPFTLDYSTTNIAVNNIGTPIAGITTDINEFPRSMVSPDPGAFENPGFPLEVNLHNFSGYKKGNDVHLNWSVSSEKNMKSYEVERSANGSRFETVGKVTAIGDAGTASYSFTDIQAFNGESNVSFYYRLKMTENSGTYQYSATYKVMATVNEEVVISLYPNPVADDLHIKIGGFTAGKKAVLQVTDITGKVVKVMPVNSVSEKISMKNLVPGIYSILYSDGVKRQVIKVEKK
ncbi:MAG TPA: T9SS type A sorting domain-containing protein [Flavipsychrobacter sp.]|nr:T9SS type A sorting domain-containing protein [Flavipsychrobacter sp.]